MQNKADERVEAEQRTEVPARKLVVRKLDKIETTDMCPSNT